MTMPATAAGVREPCWAYVVGMRTPTVGSEVPVWAFCRVTRTWPDGARGISERDVTRRRSVRRSDFVVNWAVAERVESVGSGAILRRVVC
jgi:hypothetical protein